MKKLKIRRSVWIPSALLIYAAAISICFGPDLIAAGRTLQLSLSVAFELLLIIGAHFALRRREKIR